MRATQCFFCSGVWHPSTGCYYNERVMACGPCTREFWTWFRNQTRKRWGRCDFYAAAVKFNKREMTDRILTFLT